MIARIGVKVSRVGWHSWPRAAGRRAYLGSLHRHRFELVVELDVRHNDRDVEFHDLADHISAWWGEETSQHDRGSCEGLAKDLWTVIDDTYPARHPQVSVCEDGEAWARLEA